MRLLLAAKVPSATILAFVSTQLRWACLLVGHPVSCCGFCFAFIGVHALTGHCTRPRLISLSDVRFYEWFGVTVFCHFRIAGIFAMRANSTMCQRDPSGSPSSRYCASGRASERRIHEGDRVRIAIPHPHRHLFLV